MIVVSFTACYEQLPDPEAFAQCLRDSFQEYLALVRPAGRRKAQAASVHKPAQKLARKPAAAPRAVRRKAAPRATLH